LECNSTNGYLIECMCDFKQSEMLFNLHIPDIQDDVEEVN